MQAAWLILGQQHGCVYYRDGGWALAHMGSVMGARRLKSSCTERLHVGRGTMGEMTSSRRRGNLLPADPGTHIGGQKDFERLTFRG